ncbi:MAG: hypothetical protein ACI9DC_001053 [Gammaproteobacteria bacterium]|jgi:hypothetical protein
MRVVVFLVAVALIALGAWYTYGLWAPALDLAATEPSTTAPAGTAPGVSTAPAAIPATSDAQTVSTVPSASSESTQQQAETFVAALTQPDPAPMTVEHADHFVTGQQMISLVPKEAVQDTTVDELIRDSSLAPNAPITVVREVEQVERVTPEKLIAQSAGNLDAPIQVLRNNVVELSTVREVLASASRAPDMPIDVVTQTEYFEQTTPAELAKSEAGHTNQPIKIIRKHHAAETSSIAKLMREQQVKSDSMFYVRTVRQGDDHGIWGIVHDGIIENFARGMAIRRGKEIHTYKVDIPSDADERRADTSSSFLGRLIFNKSKASHVYNFNNNRMGRNPHRIFPGQEIVIIDFQPEELIEIYKHFVAQRG